MLTRNQHWNEWPGFGRLESLDELRREMNRLLFDFGRDFGFGREFADVEGRFATPRMLLTDNGTALVLRAELPGLSDKDVELTVNANTLTLRAERKAEPPQGYSVHRRERQSFEISRSFELPCKIDPDAAEAVMKNGVLTLTLPKAAEAQPKRIAVKTS